MYQPKVNVDKLKLVLTGTSIFIDFARSTLRSSEHSTKRTSRDENMWKVCLFYSQNNKIVWLSNMADIFFLEIHQVHKGLWAFFLIVLFECWLAEQTNSHHVVRGVNKVWALVWITIWCYEQLNWVSQDNYHDLLW